MLDTLDQGRRLAVGRATVGRNNQTPLVICSEH